MKRLFIFFVDCLRKLKSYIYTFVFKQQLVSFGEHIGAARYIKISRAARVSVGHNCGFNGMIISGMGG